MFPFEIVPKVHIKPVLTVPARAGMIERMVQYDKNEFRERFSARLKRALANAGVPEHGSGAYLQRLTGVTAKAASKWLNAESMPGSARIPVIARDLGVSTEWLHYGDGDMRRPSASDSTTLELTGATRARTLREKHKGETSTRADELIMHTTEVVEGGEPRRPDEVDLPCFREVEFAAGDGRTQVVESGGHTMRFPLAKLVARGVSPGNAACATASGSSMTPTIVDGSPIAIDRGTRHIIDGKIYALDHGGMLRIKRLYKLPMGRVRLVSDNADEYPEEIHGLMGPDAPKVIGRVFWWEVFD